jgi:hypothetical protein
LGSSFQTANKNREILSMVDAMDDAMDAAKKMGSGRTAYIARAA